MHYMEANQTYEWKLHWDYTNILCDVLNQSWKQYPIYMQVYDYWHPILQIIQTK